MDFIREMVVFDNWLRTSYLPPVSQLLWYKLFMLCNSAGWPEWFVVGNWELMAALKISNEKSFISHRDRLIETGLIDYRKGKKGSPSQYKLLSLSKNTGKMPVQTPVQTPVNTAVQTPVQMTAQTPAIYKQKEDKDTDNKKDANASKKAVSKIKYAEYVTMTEAEHSKLAAEHGEQATSRMIAILDNYKGASGKRYASDYRAILNWVVGRYQEEQQKNGKTLVARYSDESFV